MDEEGRITESLEGRDPAGRCCFHDLLSLRRCFDDSDRGLLVKKVVKAKNHRPR